MDDLQLLVELHKAGLRQGPGGDAETRRALELAVPDPSQRLKVADIGCGTGASTLILGRELQGPITAVDLFPEFLEVLQARAKDAGLDGQVTTRCCSMDALPFSDGEFDLIWSEGAIYNMGFEAGIVNWRRFLKPGGVLVVSEITWLTGARPAEIDSHWNAEYPEINTASAKMGLLESHGYSPIGYFVLPKTCWSDNYYGPLQGRFSAFLQAHAGSEQARAIVEAEEREIALYEKYHSYYSYGVYIAKRHEA